jgi:hypothetical protein
LLLPVALVSWAGADQAPVVLSAYHIWFGAPVVGWYPYQVMCDLLFESTAIWGQY